jgi:hypothetical protein
MTHQNEVRAKLSPREQREKIKALVAQHLVEGLDPETCADKRSRPSASMIHAALSFLKCTDPTLGQLSPEEMRQRAEEEQAARETATPLMADGRPFVSRLDPDEVGTSLANEREDESRDSGFASDLAADGA